MTKQPASNATPLMSIMMFLQFFTWGAWFATLGAALNGNGLSGVIADAYATAPIAAIFAPLFLGLIADRFFASEKVMGTLLILGAAFLLVIPGLAVSIEPETQTAEQTVVAKEDGTKDQIASDQSGKEEAAKSGTEKADADGGEEKELTEAEKKTQRTGGIIVWLILAHMCCYMPTLGLGNTIAFTHILQQNDFPKIRVWGTIGWIIAGLVVGGLGWSSSMNIFWLAGVCSAVLGLFCFMLPNTPPPLKGKPFDVRSLLMVDAWKLMKDWNFLVFAICSTLICIPLAYYYGSTSQFLTQTGFSQPAATMTLGQMSEIFFMLLIPFFFRRLGFKVMIMIGMACWVIRYALFAFGAPDQISWMLLSGVAIHGICYDFFFVTGFMYTDQKAPVEIRGQAQALLVFLTQGVGMFIGYRIMGTGSLLGWTIGDYGKPVGNIDQYGKALKEASGDGEAIGFFESFGRMFSRDLPEKLDPTLLSETMLQWKGFWILPSIMAFGILVIFALTFWDKGHLEEDEKNSPTK